VRLLRSPARAGHDRLRARGARGSGCSGRWGRDVDDDRSGCGQHSRSAPRTRAGRPLCVLVARSTPVRVGPYVPGPRRARTRPATAAGPGQP
jgi:hypothetical protein